MKSYTGVVADEYEKIRADTDEWVQEHRIMREILVKYNPGRVMDVPCGTGRFHELYEELGVDAVGIDISPDMTKYATQRGMEVKIGDIFSIDFTDFVVCVRLFNHINRNKKIELLKKVKGCLVYTFRDINNDGKKMIADAGLTLVETYPIICNRPGYNAMWVVKK
jgi:SAM-dependent methyltransferase